MSNGFPIVRLGEVLTSVERPEQPVPGKEYRQIGVKLWGQGAYERDPIDGARTRYQTLWRVETDDIIINKIWARNGSVAVVLEGLAGCYGSNEFPTFAALREKLEPRWFHWLTKTRMFWQQCDEKSRGTSGKNRIRPERFLEIEIPLPPLAEQRRIVARIDELAAKIKEAQELRRVARLETDSLMRASRNNVVSQLRKKYSDVQLGDVCDKVTDGPHVSPNYTQTGVPFISVRNIAENGLDFTTAKFVSEKDHEEFSKKAPVELGDVLYTKGGTTGVAQRIDTERPFNIWVHVALLKLKRHVVESGFVEHMLNAPSSKEQAELYTHGSSNRDLGLTRMVKILFPLPPIDQQRRVVEYLDNVQAKVGSLKRTQAETAAELDALLPSTLNKAFKGEI